MCAIDRLQSMRESLHAWEMCELPAVCQESVMWHSLKYSKSLLIRPSGDQKKWSNYRLAPKKLTRAACIAVNCLVIETVHSSASGMNKTR